MVDVDVFSLIVIVSNTLCFATFLAKLYRINIEPEQVQTVLRKSF